MRLLTVLFVLAAMAASTGVVLQWRALRDGRLEAGALTEESTKIIQPQEHAAADHELDQLREQSRDLLKLRNQVRQLRSQSAALAQARAENTRLHELSRSTGEVAVANSAAPAGFTGREALAEAGLATPEATIQTFFRSMRDGDLRRFTECFSPRSRQPKNIDQLSNVEMERRTLELTEMMQSFTNFRIVERKEISPDEVVLSLQSSTASKPMPLTLRRFGSEWLIE
jgi:hypothetical protein